MKINIKIVSLFLLFILFKTGYSLDLGFFKNPNNNDQVVYQINNAFKESGIDKGFVERNKDNEKIELKGDYKDYDQFLSAYMIAQAIAGVNEVSPAFDVENANIIIRNTELCSAAAMLGKPERCPTYIATITQKTDKEFDKKMKKSGKYAILIGVGQFKYINAPLGDAPLNDIQLVKTALEKRGFNVLTLKNEEATYENTKKTIARVINMMKDGDTLFLFASSHGSPKSPEGETGVVLYDTSVEGVNCKDLEPDKINNQATRDIIITAKKMCNLLKNSLSLEEDVLPLIITSGKNINFIASFDICYSGGALKNILGNVKNESYAMTDKSAEKIVNFVDFPFAYISSASGAQQALQKKFVDKEYGIFTYYYYTTLPTKDYNLVKTYRETKDNISKESAETCREIKSRNTEGSCADTGQTPLLIKNNKLPEEYKP